MGKNSLNWREEYEKCKNDIPYFYENYCLINGKKPGEYSIERFKRYIQDNREKRAMLLKRGQDSEYFKFMQESPLTPSEAFPQINFLKDEQG